MKDTIDITYFTNKLEKLKEFLYLFVDSSESSTFEDYFYKYEVEEEIRNLNRAKDKENLPIIITDHAYQRAKERLGFNKSSFSNLAIKAYDIGITHGDCIGNLKKYFDRLYLQKREANNIKIYGENVFMFKNNILMTVYKLPNNLLKAAKNAKRTITKDS